MFLLVPFNEAITPPPPFAYVSLTRPDNSKVQRRQKMYALQNRKSTFSKPGYFFFEIFSRGLLPEKAETFVCGQEVVNATVGTIGQSQLAVEKQCIDS